MKQLIKNAKLVLPTGIEDGCVEIDEGRIGRVGRAGEDESGFDRVVDLQGDYLAPGFVELHTHGAGGADFMDGTLQAYKTACMAHLQKGTTTLYPTLLAASDEEICTSLLAFRAAKEELRQQGITLPGVHLEGPYLNPEQKGAINEAYIRAPQESEYRALLQEFGAEIARWTVAPEVEGAYALGDCLKEYGVVGSVGHSNAVYAQVKEAVKHGYTHVTHLYSTMSTITRRNGFRYSGLLESAFCIPELTVEIIADGCHLPPELLRFTYQSKGVHKVALTCDSMRCAGQNVRASFLGSVDSGLPVIIEDEVAKLPDRSAFAGSVATDDRLVRVMHTQAEVPLHDAVRMMTLTPAQIMGIDAQKGSIEVGKDADLIRLDKNLHVRGVITQGQVRTGEWNTDA